jgi:predicted transcriptional regulator
MSLVSELTAGMLRKEGGFQEALRKILEEDLDMSVHDFCVRTGLSPSTVYKILQEKREPNLRTVRTIVMAIRKLEFLPQGNFIAVIASRPVLSTIEEKTVRIDNQNVIVKEYPASTMEEAIISSVKAERDGASSIVCAPIIAPTVEKILTIPVTVIIPGGSLFKAIEKAAKEMA